MKEGTVLEQTRRWALWVALGSAVLALVITLLAVWDAVSLVHIPTIEDILGPLAMQSLAGDLGDAGGMMGPGGLADLGSLNIEGPHLTAWGRLLGTFCVLLTTSGTVLLSLLVASHVKRGEK